MAASPYRCTVTIDSTKFDAVATSVKFSTDRDSAGMPQMGSLSSSVRVWADFHDSDNLSHAAVKKFFTLAKEKENANKVKDIKIEYWKDENRQDPLAAYNFKGWISRFETCNPHELAPATADEIHPAPPSNLNHMMVLDLQPATNRGNFSEVKLTA